MEIIKKSQSGSFESSDIMILVEPVENNIGRKVEIDSSVMSEYGKQIKKIISDKLDEFKVSNIHLIAKDKGALDITIAARVETALIRASNTENVNI